jgi:SAM-dependent methyltransferase
MDRIRLNRTAHIYPVGTPSNSELEVSFSFANENRAGSVESPVFATWLLTLHEAMDRGAAVDMACAMLGALARDAEVMLDDLLATGVLVPAEAAQEQPIGLQWQELAGTMEARAREPASEAMFADLVRPLLRPSTRHILEVGCGTGPLARWMHRAAPDATILATDASDAMVDAARSLTTDASAIRFSVWDVNDEASWPSHAEPFDLIISSTLAPYLSDAQTESLVIRLVKRLAPHGLLAFVEQDIATHSLNFPSADLRRRILIRDGRPLKRTLGLGLRPLLRSAGLTVLPRKSFLWAVNDYGPYARTIVREAADDALHGGRISEAERQDWDRTLDVLASTGDFYLSVVYHLVAGKRATGAVLA